jgi:hypothetical protein
LRLGALVAFGIGLASASAVSSAAPVKQAPAKKASATKAPATTASKTAPKLPTNTEGAVPTGAPTKTAAKSATSAGTADAVKDSGRRETEVYGERLQGIESEVNALKDKVFRSKARLAVLRETVLQGVMAGSRVMLAHRNLMGTGFRLIKIVYYLDGAQIFIKEDEGGTLDGLDEISVYDGNLVPGPHEARVELTYSGNGYGVFSYLRDYEFTSSQTQTFNAPKDGAIKLVSKGFEKGNFTTEMADRPAVKWQMLEFDAAGNPSRARASAKRGGASKKKPADGKK